MSRRTAAADRILAAARRLAGDRSAESVEPSDLLAAVLADESRGAELLSPFGIRRDDAATAALCGRFEPAGDDEPLFESPGFKAVVEAADAESRAAGRTAELGSEHLAVALAVAASPVADFLRSRGVTAAALNATGSVAAPVPIETGFSLDPDAAPLDRRQLVRAIDAAANRAAEGLRVAEDYARFVADDAHLTGILKRLRHAVAEAASTVPLPERLAARDSRGDVGAAIPSPAAERGRLPADLPAANLHRAEEALRSLEEFGRLVDPALGPRFERLRYEVYAIEKSLATAAAANERLAGRDLYVLLTSAACSLPVEEVIRGAAAGGAGVFQVREKTLPDRELLARLRVVRRHTREAGALLIVNDRPDLAVLCDADGVHVGQEELPVREARRIVGPSRLVGVSTHTIEQARAAVLDGADYLGVGPVFPSRTKTFDLFAGIAFVEAVAAEIGLPWYAIGGIGPDNAAKVAAAGARRIAVSAAVCAADDPRNAAAALALALTHAKSPRA